VVVTVLFTGMLDQVIAWGGALKPLRALGAQLRIVATANFPDFFVANSCHAVFGLLLPSCLSELWAILSRRLGRRAFPGMDYPTPWKKFRQRHLKLSHRRARERDRHSAMNSCASSAKGFAGAGLVFGT
jgi:hypothetical protein